MAVFSLSEFRYRKLTHNDIYEEIVTFCFQCCQLLFESLTLLRELRSHADCFSVGRLLLTKPTLVVLLAYSLTCYPFICLPK